jgi:hypothetical protein
MASEVWYDISTGGTNAENISSDQNFADVITVKCPTSKFDMLILGIQVRYPDGAEDSEIKIKDSDGNTLIDGNVQLSQIGNRSKADIARDEFPVRLLLKVGTTVIIAIKTASGKTIAKEKLNVAFFGKNSEIKERAK